jgi:CheY-like chemotaxis protein
VKKLLDHFSVAIVDDDESLCRSLCRLLRAAGLNLVAYPSAEAFLGDAQRPPFGCLLRDVQLDGISGIELQRQLIASGVKTPVIFLTAYDDPEWRAQAIAAGCAAYFRKTDPGAVVLEAIRRAAMRKNHLGDKDEFLPTNHGFDEFFGNLYHLNAEEEPENCDYPKNPEFKKKFGPRGVIRSYADGRIEDTGPLTSKRMETIDEEFLAAAQDFLARVKKSDKPFFCWFNTTRMHNFSHVKQENLGKTGLGFYADGMVEHDALVGRLLKTADDLGLTNDTIVIYTTDNGPME